MNRILIAACFAVFLPLAYGDQGGLLNSGGSLAGGSSVANPPGTLTISGNNLTFLSSDNSTIINATFTTSSTVENCSGGGKGGHVTCSYTFTGAFSGTLAANGYTQAINGATYQIYGTNGVVAAGNTGYNSAYTPFYFTDGNARILRADDLSGTNAISYGTQGSGVGQFYGPQGIALDSSGRIYIADIYNDRIVRIDDMNGTNWTSYGTYGAGQGQFTLPQSVSVDPSGHIWVVDGTGRLIRMDDMNGTNWTTVATAGGSGVGQFAGLSSAPGFDSLGRIYVADSGNGWIVRFDDLNFTNWTTSPALGAITGVVVDPAGKIYAADSIPAGVIRIDDMTGANRTSIGLGTFGAKTIAIDSSGMVLLGNGYEAQIDDSQATVLTSKIDGQILVQGVYANVYGAVPLPLPSPRPSAISFTPATLTFSQNAGSTSAPQNITVTNFGGSNINGLTLSAGAPFAETNNCPAVLIPAASCTVSVTFTPAAQGAASGTISVSDDSYNLGSSQTLILSGTGTAPAATITPASLSFSSQVIGTSSTARNVTVQSNGSGPLQITNITVAAPFSETDNCTGSIAPAASCSVAVVFSPTTVGSASGVLTITDNAGTQTVSLSGSGASPVTLSSTSLSFGSLAVGSTSAAKTVTVTNRLSTALTFTGISVPAGGPFAISSNTCGAGIAAGASCTVGVSFTPAAAGAATGTLTFADSAINSPQTVSLSGTGTAPVTFSASSLSFGTVTVGNTSSTKTVTLTNRLSVALTLSPAVVSSGFNIASNTCGTSVAAGASCAVGVTFTPTATGAAAGTLTFTDSAVTSPQTITLSGTGGATSSPVTLSAGTLNFGTVTTGSTSAPITITLTNRQSVSLGFTSIGITGPFAIASNTCGTSIGAGAGCSVGVTFSPTATGAATGTLTFADNATNSPQKVTLSGTGSAPVSVSATTLNFGVVAVGSVSAGQTVTITNASANAVAINGISVTGDFADTTTCASSIPAGNNCTVTVTFTPSVGGTRTGTLTLNLSTGALTVSLTGAGSSGSQTGALALSPTTLTFSGYTIGDNPSRTITVTNTSGAAAGIAAIGMSGDPSLTQRNNCGASVAAGGTCSITVTFQPVAYGTFTGTLTVTESSGALDTVQVTGISAADN
ncbi:MAG TPA: choice-of-anchor D domain-containing protein [Bryobacteraceae bacterium]|nr:choice-of-anchor D domain-containing protein [Bryobacteraceae bacterium]